MAACVLRQDRCSTRGVRQGGYYSATIIHVLYYRVHESTTGVALTPGARRTRPSPPLGRVGAPRRLPHPLLRRDPVPCWGSPPPGQARTTDHERARRPHGDQPELGHPA